MKPALQFQRFDPAGRQVLETAWAEAAALEDGCLMTEHLLLALATTDPETATLLAQAGSSAAEVRQAILARCDRRAARPPPRWHWSWSRTSTIGGRPGDWLPN